MRIATPSTIGDNNKFAILDLVKRHDGIGREDIARALSLSAPAVSKNVNALLEAGILHERGTADTTLGRKPALLYCNRQLLYVIGMEVMPHGIRAALADFTGDILTFAESPSSVQDPIDTILAAVLGNIGTLLAQCPNPGSVAAICIATTGCTDPKNGFNLLSAYQKAWGDVDLAGEVQGRFGVPTVVMNDVELDLLGERQRGVGRAHRDILLVKYGDGFACRALVNGRLFRGARCAAGEIGYSIFAAGQVRGQFRSPGALEQTICHDVFAEFIRETGHPGPANEVGFAFLMQQANAGDAVAERYVRQVADLITVAVNNTVLVLNPELLILAGDAALLRGEDVARMEAVLRQTCPFAPEIRRAKLGKDACLHGGINVALGHAEEGLVELWKA